MTRLLAYWLRDLRIRYLTAVLTRIEAVKWTDHPDYKPTLRERNRLLRVQQGAFSQ